MPRQGKRRHSHCTALQVRRGFRLLDEDHSGRLSREVPLSYRPLATLRFSHGVLPYCLLQPACPPHSPTPLPLPACLASQELKAVLLMFNLDVKPHLVEKIIDIADQDCDGDIDYCEFARYIHLLYRLRPRPQLQPQPQPTLAPAPAPTPAPTPALPLPRIMTAEDILALKSGAGDIKFADLKGADPKRVGGATIRAGVDPKDVQYAQQCLKRLVLPHRAPAPPCRLAATRSTHYSLHSLLTALTTHVSALHSQLSEKYKRLTDAFKFIDADRTGHLERGEVKRLLLEFDVPDIKESAIEALIDFADFDGDGLINYAEFARVLTANDVMHMKDTLAGNVN